MKNMKERSLSGDFLSIVVITFSHFVVVVWSRKQCQVGWNGVAAAAAASRHRRIPRARSQLARTSRTVAASQWLS